MKSLLVDARISEEAERELMRLGFNVMKLPPLSALPRATESHADTLIFHYKNTQNILTKRDGGIVVLLNSTECYIVFMGDCLIMDNLTIICC